MQVPGRTTRDSSHSLLELRQTMLPQQPTARTNAFAIHAKGLATIVPTASMSSGHSDSHLTGMRTTGRKGQGFLPQTGCLVHLQLGPDTTSLTNIQKNKIGSDTTGLTV